jgi:hypothetical protein
MAWWSRRQHAPPRFAEPEGFADGDLAELNVVFAAAEAEEARRRDARLAILIAPLVARRVPARIIEAVPSLHAARIRFADGTSVLVRGRVPGDVGVLACWVRDRRVVPVRCSPTSSGMELAFSVSDRPCPFVLRVTGLDQPD